MKIKVHLNCNVVCVDGKTKIYLRFEGVIAAQALPREGESIWIDATYYHIFKVEEVVHNLVGGILRHCLSCVEADEALILSTVLPKITDEEAWIREVLIPSMEKCGFKKIEDDVSF